MSANTRLRSRYHNGPDPLLLRLAKLYVCAHELIQKEARSGDSVEELLRALQLFKEEKLDGIVLPLPSNTPSPLMKRRNEFIARVRELGHDAVYREFLNELSVAMQNRITLREATSFPELLTIVSNRAEYRQRLADTCGWGKLSSKKIHEALRRRGLDENMTLNEIEHIFPNQG